MRLYPSELSTEITQREQFVILLSNQPILKGDAVILLCGEDAGPRVAVATQLMRSGGADTIVLSGGVDNPPRWQGAKRLEPVLMGQGVAYSHIVLEAESQHTWDQAVNVVKIAQESGWKRLLLVASAYHAQRAYLTFLKALQYTKQEESIYLVNVSAGQSPWFQAPEGMTMTRLELLGQEFEKLGQYHDHVASYEDGLKYLSYWESAR